ncbi:protein phosphatase 2C domain-containing protein [Micromonospora sp. NPDC049900]|uniref:protein phosphatase 2C domain-containing protein n=1 Tax=Micromonospora sp. NPDC049900 TaxID=3364275 RepID=UPI0037874303
MHVSLATLPAKSYEPNEDFTAATTNGVVLLDGAGLSGTTTKCHHGVSWYARHLGGALAAGLPDEDRDLISILAEGIRETAALHANTCDLDDPGTPSATVVMIRTVADHLQYLVLADSVLLLDVTEGEPVAVCDNREEEVGRGYRAAMDAAENGTPEHDKARRAYVDAMRVHRNRPDGFWVAAADPEAAHEAITGEIPVHELRSVLLLSDGASRITDRFNLAGWPEVIAMAATEGPAAILQRVREAERLDLNGARWPRGKTHDDATAAYCTQLQVEVK